ncbi:MAG: hypothetical protein IIB81_05145, partial [Nanoarchaeota archaeon]|nr:hypothetical protein [Nanoarchaeota archaeon]
LIAENKPDGERPKNVVYGDNDGQERQNNYGPNIIDYLEIRQRALHDFSDRVPGKHIDIFPENVGGLLGYTHIGDVKMGRREDLIGDHETDIHECIHTTDEYETRILASWIMSKEKNDNYVR